MDFRCAFFARLLLTVGLLSLGLERARAQDPSIERLLSKLPPPEQLVKPQVQRALQQQDPAMRDPLVPQIQQAIRAHNLPGARVMAKTLSARYSRSVGSLNLSGVLAFAVRQFPEAIAEFQRALAIKPDFSPAHLNLGNVEAARGRFAAAMPHFIQVTKIEPRWFGGWFLASACAEKLGHKQEALSFAKRATEVSPATVNCWIQLAKTEKALGHTAETLKALGRAGDLLPDNPNLLAAVGFGYINLKREREAIPPLQRAARLAPENALVQAQLGYCLQATGQLESAATHLRKATSLAPKYPGAWEHLGLTYQKQGRHREAVDAFEKSIQLAPGYRASWERLAMEYRALGQTDKAARATARARSLPATRIVLAPR